MTTTELETLIVRMVGDSTSYMRMLNQAQRATLTFSQAVTQSLQRLSLMVAAPLVAIGATAVKQFANFDDAITKAAAITNATEEQVAKMRDTALELSTKSVQGPIELAKAFYDLLSTGVDINQAIKQMPAVAKFATASLMETGESVKFLSGAVNALGLDSEDPVKNLRSMVRVGDALVKLNNEAIGTTKDFSKALTNEAAAAMRQYGISLEDGLAVLGAYAKQNVLGEHAGSMFARMLRLITQAAVDHSKEFKQLGVEIFDQNGVMRDTVDIVQNLSEVLGPLSTESRTVALGFLGIKARSQGAILPLLGMAEVMKKLRNDVKAAGKETDNVANKQLQSFSSQIKIAANNVIVMAIRVGEILAPAVMYLAQGIKQLTQQFKSLSPSTQRLIVYTAAITAGMLILATVIATVVFMFSTIGASVLIPMAVIALLASGLMYLEKETGLVSKAWQYLQTVGAKVWAGLVKVTRQLAGEIQPVIDAIMDVSAAIWKELYPIIADIQVELEKLWKEIGQDVKDIWEWTTPLRAALFDLAAVLIKVVGGALLITLKNTIKFIRDSIWLFRTLYSAVSSVMRSIERLTGASWANIQTVVITAIAKVEFAIVNFGKVADLVFMVVGLGAVRLGENFKHLFGTTIPHLINYFKEYAIATFNAVFDYIKQFTINSINLLANIPNLVPELIAKGFSGKELRQALEMAFGSIVPKKLDIQLPKLDLPKRGETPLEAEMLKMIQEQLKGLDTDFDKFLEEKLKRFNKPLALKHPIDLPPGEDLLPNIDEDAIEDLGKKIGKALGMGIGKEMDKFQVPDRWEGVLADSVKGMIELQEYRKKIFGGRFLPMDDKLPKDKPIRPLLPPPGFGPGSEPDFRPFNPNPPITPRPPRIDHTPFMPHDIQFPPLDIPHVPEVEVKPGLAKFSPTMPSIGNPLKGIEEFLKDSLSKSPDRPIRPIPVQVTTTPNSQGIPNTPDVKEIGNKLVTRDERVPGLLEEILRELKLSNKNNKLKIGGGLS